GSPQVVKLHATVHVFEKWDEPLNIITDSQYVEGVVQHLEGAWLKSTDHEDLYLLFRRLQHLISNRKLPYYIPHIRSHTQLPGPIAKGSALADKLAAPRINAPLPDALQQALLSHTFYHQSAKSLQRMFHIPLDSERQLIKMCPDCQSIAPLHPAGVNPRGLRALQLWQTDVTHVPEFGRYKYKYIYVLDTFSKAVWASPLTGETSKHTISHWMAAFATLGVPSEIKTDNGPCYTSQKTATFLVKWGVRHIT
ncbi:POK6 protein, partial [Probosciger aterrimus]|nr:POK6 protein [Probosciger aterrimus]